MSVGPLSFIGSLAATPLSQRAADTDRSAIANSTNQGEIKNIQSADEAAGIGQTDGEQHESHDRDADGRRLWEQPLGKNPNQQHAPEENEPNSPPRSKDLNGESGIQLDLLG